MSFKKIEMPKYANERSQVRWGHDGDATQPAPRRCALSLTLKMSRTSTTPYTLTHTHTQDRTHTHTHTQTEETTRGDLVEPVQLAPASQLLAVASSVTPAAARIPVTSPLLILPVALYLRPPLPPPPVYYSTLLIPTPSPFLTPFQ